MFDNVKIVHEAYPDKNLIFTEGCPESFNPAGIMTGDSGKHMVAT